MPKPIAIDIEAIDPIRPDDHGLILVVGLPGTGTSYEAVRHIADGHILIHDDAESLPEFDMKFITNKVINIMMREDYYAPATIRQNFAQQQGDQWRRNGKRKGRKGR